MARPQNESGAGSPRYWLLVVGYRWLFPGHELDRVLDLRWRGRFLRQPAIWRPADLLMWRKRRGVLWPYAAHLRGGIRRSRFAELRQLNLNVAALERNFQELYNRAAFDHIIDGQ